MPLAPPQLLRLSTEMLPERDRMAAFREEFARRVLNMDVVDRSDGKPRVDLTSLRLGSVVVSSLAATSIEFLREHRHVMDGTDGFLLGVVVVGPVRLRHAEQDHCCDTGTAVLIHHERPEITTFENGHKVRNIIVPAAALKELVAQPEDRAGDLVRLGPALHLLDGYLQSLAGLEEPPSAELGHLIGLHLIDLTAAAIGPTAEGREIIGSRGLKAARLHAVLVEIARHFANPALDVDAVAGRLGLSRRGVQRLLEETGRSFTEHLTERRLQRAYAMLGDPAFSHLRIIDIAFAAGFGDLSNFNRLFRRRFGDTPSALRAAG